MWTMGKAMKLTQTDFSDVVAAMQSPVDEPALEPADDTEPLSERRHAARVAVSANVRAWVVQPRKLGQAIIASARNVSLIGMELVSEFPFAPGQELIVALPRLSGPPLYCCAMIARCTPQSRDRVQCGLEFSAPAPEQVIKAIQSRSQTEVRPSA
jgi:hypothetical protein